MGIAAPEAAAVPAVTSLTGLGIVDRPGEGNLREGCLHTFFGEMFIQILWPLLNQVTFLLVNFKSSLYILDTGPLPDI